MIPKEFYDQKKWREIHREADQLIFTKSGKCLTAVYKSPYELVRQDQEGFIEMLQDWAKTLEV